MFKLICLFAFLFAVNANIDVTISLSSSSYLPGRQIIVDWEMKSTSGFGNSILVWNTPLEGEWNSNMFSIQSENGVASYQGKLVKRAEPTLKNYELVPTFAGRSGQLVLNEGYKFFATGEYTVALSFFVNTISGDSFQVVSNSVTLTVEHADIQVTLPISQPRTVSFHGCSSPQTSTCQTAINGATSSSLNAKTYLDPGPSSDISAYTEWFGDYTSSRWSTVRNGFNNIWGRFHTLSFGIDCSTCTDPNLYAYVYPNDSAHTIYVCPYFWNANNYQYQYDSKPGTLIHEMSHFDDTAGNYDYQYGTRGCRSLAQSNPNEAVKNADSFEFFSESNP